MVQHNVINHTGLPGIGSGAVATDTIWDAAGDLAVGTGANTAARVALGAAGGAVSCVNGALAWNSGTSFPTATTGDRYWRTDLGLEFYYDGTRWLCICPHMMEFNPNTGSGISADTTIYRASPLHTTYDLWMVTFYSTTFIETTNNGTNYWTITLSKTDASNGLTTVASVNTSSGQAITTWVTRATAIGAALTPGTYPSFSIAAAKTLSPGTLYGAYKLLYRLIGV